MTVWVVVAGQATAETNVGAGRARVDFPRGAVLPDDVPAEDIERLAALGQIAKAPAEPAAVVDGGDSEAAVDGDAVPEGTIAVVMAWVGADVGRARRALEVEQLKGDKARLTLVGELERILQA